MIGFLVIANLSLLFYRLLPKGVRFTFCAMILLRSITSICNVILDQGLPGGLGDSVWFFERVSERVHSLSLDWNITSLFYGVNSFFNIHILWQWIFGGPDFLLAHTLSLTGSILCLFVISRIWLLLSPGDIKGLRWLLVLYTLTPSVITNQSYFLREVWQSLFILGVAWLGLLIRSKGYSLMRLIFIFLITLAGATLHEAMIFMMISSLLLAMFIAGQKEFYYHTHTQKLVFSKKFIITILLMVLGVSLLSPLIVSSHRIAQFKSGELIQAAEVYTQKGELGARAEYGSIFRFSQPLTIVPTFLAYQIMPTPDRVSGLSDFILAIENVFRVSLLFIYLFMRKKLSYFQKSTGDIYFLMWFGIELIWSIGTLNWGTAARHHVPAYALILLNGMMAYRAKTKNSVNKRVNLNLS